jgi:hypothetical protein
MAEPKEGYNSGVDRNVTGTIDSSGEFVAGSEASGFKPSSYTGNITSVNAGVSFAMATGARRLLLQNLETTDATEYAVVAFGEDSATAISNLTIATNVSTTGPVVRSGDATAGGIGPDFLIGIPANAQDGGFAALGNGVASADQIVRVTQGV